jgi:hypothetical protein
MATTEPRPAALETAEETVYVDRFCDGIIGPSAEVLGTVRDGGTIVANTAPGCWGPMITPAIKGGHEVTLPVNVEGAEVGDAIAIRIRSIDVTSVATSSGNDRTIEGRFNGDPYCAKVCPSCGAEDEETVVEGIGEDAVRCANCGAPAAPFAFTNGYTMAFDDARRLGVTVGSEQAVRERVHDHGAPGRRLDRHQPQPPDTGRRSATSWRSARTWSRVTCSPATTGSTERSAGASSGSSSASRANRSATVAPSATSTVFNGAAERRASPAPRRTRTVTLPPA